MPELGLGADNHAEDGNAEDGVVLGESPPGSPQNHFQPIIQLPLVDVSTNEEEEVEMIKLRAKLYRYDTSDSPAEWKERGTGDAKLLRHKTKNTVRVVMRRDKTLKLCANHFVWPWMELNPNCKSDRAWVWSALADFADEQPKPQLLAIRFANAENARLWKEAFDKAKRIVETECAAYSGKVGSDSDSESDCSDDKDNEEAKTIDQENKATAEDNILKDKTATETAEVNKATDEVTTDLEKLDVKERE